MMTKITVPPKPAEPVVIGEIDLDLMRTKGELVRMVFKTLSNQPWSGYMVEHNGGTIIHVPGVRPSEL